MTISHEEQVVKNALATKVSLYRYGSGESQRAFGKRIGLTGKTIQRIENENSTFVPTLSSLIKIANGLNISLEVLFKGI